MGVVNLSPDSWYRESVAPTAAAAVRRGIVLTAQGADFVDVGAESVVDGSARVGAEAQVEVLVPVVEELSAAGVLVSVESYKPEVVRAALGAGAKILNLTGSADDASMFDLAAEHDAALVLCHVLGAHPRDLHDTEVVADPYPEMLEQFERRVADARARGVAAGISVDPGVGFGFKRLTEPRARTRYQADDTAQHLPAAPPRRAGVPRAAQRLRLLRGRGAHGRELLRRARRARRDRHPPHPRGDEGPRRARCDGRPLGQCRLRRGLEGPL